MRRKIMKIINLEQRSPEWLEYRRAGIGASDASSIMGVGFKSQYQLFHDKMSGRETVVNAAMQRGIDMEEAARQEFIKMHGISVSPAVVENDLFSWQFASLDGMDVLQEFFVEIKCPGPKNHEVALNGLIPETYYPQLQHQFCVTGMKEGYYFSFDGNEGVLLEVKRNDDYIANLLEKEKEFYNRMCNFDPPLLVDKDVIVLDDPEWNEVCAEYKRVKCELSAVELREKKLKERFGV